MKLLESLNTKAIGKVTYRRYNLPEIISESYGLLYKCERGSTLRKLVESHLADVKENPTDIDRLSRQLCDLKKASKLVESNELEDTGLLVPEESHDTVGPKEDRGLGLKESKDDENVEEKDDENLLDESVHDEDVSEEDDEDLLEADLTDEELEELSKHLEEIRKGKKVAECDDKKVTEGSKGRKLKRRVNEASSDTRIFQYGIDIEQPGSTDSYEEESKLRKVLQDAGYNVVGCMASDTSWTKEEYGMFESKETKVTESASWDNISLANFNKNSVSKAFVKTFKKLDKKLHEGTALTRQESISLYKAANSAMTHLSVELEHNPEFLDTFKESVTLLSVDVERLLASLKEGKAPSKANMKSLAKFSEALLREAEEDEEELDIEGEENEVADEEMPAEETSEEAEEMAEESEEFDQEYADARVELHKELADEHADTENPEIAEKIAQDAEEVVSLPGITDEQVAEITGEDVPAEEEVEEPAEEEASEEEVDLDLGDIEGEDITDDELAELKKHLTEMRKARRAK